MCRTPLEKLPTLWGCLERSRHAVRACASFRWKCAVQGGHIRRTVACRPWPPELVKEEGREGNRNRGGSCYKRPCCAATATACARVSTPSLWKTEVRC